VDLLRQLAENLTFGVEALCTRATLRESEARYHALVEQASDGIFLADTQGRFVDVNPAGCALLGYSRDEMLQLGIRDLVAPEDLADQPHYLEKVRAGEAAIIDRRLKRRDGSPVQAEISARIIDQGLIIGILRDITVRKQMEEQIRNQATANDRLLEEVRRRIKFVQALRNIDIAVAGSLDLRVTFSVLLDEITAQLGLDAAVILLLDQNALTLKYAAWRGFRTGVPERLRLRLGEGLAGCAALERRTLHIPSLPEAASDLLQVHHLADEGFVTYYAVPLVAKGRLQGVLEVFHRSVFEPDGEWLHFLETLAGQAATAIDNVALFDQLQRSHLELDMAYDATLEGWAYALDLRDKETEGHSRRVTEMTLRLARELGVKEEELVHIRRGALLHDIGKMGVPDAVLLKPGPLTEEEWEVMRRHPRYAYEMLSPIAYLRSALGIPYCHHEKWDGTGYPRGLKGEQIPLAARIFAVVDVWDALSSERPYRPAWPPEKVRTYLGEQGGKHFDPRVVEAFLKILAEEEK